MACSAHAQSFKLQLPLESDPDVVLQEVVVDAKQTRVTLLVKNSTNEAFEACAQPTGSPDAFTLKDLGSGANMWEAIRTGCVSAARLQQTTLLPRLKTSASVCKCSPTPKPPQKNPQNFLIKSKGSLMSYLPSSQR